ncbi:3-oxo-Delta(4,5)-steroid 5-beta-reductase-like [Senna tora]|uniref:3-oxo-Delta(4,5)-steroid 5-beta-reductase-like n=1 Tax=Senna tora TaxID=362788 RepID=A0A834T1N7_9FABA|nr:3-oxo-Delta(4,5)-steroid 5-beta-reductase-like [Senna tora]
MGPIFDLVLSKQLAPHEPPFHDSMPRLPYPNFYYAPSMTYFVHRSSIIVDVSTRSEINALLMLAAYAVVCRHEGLPFRYSGSRYTWEHFYDMTDAWKMWKVMSEDFDVEYVEYKVGDEFDLEEWMSKKGEVLDEIVEKNGLYKTKLEEIACYATFKPVANFTFQHVSSMNKSKEYGVKVRVVKLWFMPPYNNNGPNSAPNDVQIQMVLCDRENNTIAATVKSIYLNKFKSVLKDGGVYVLSKFAIGISGGNFRVTNNVYKINFQFSTHVVPDVEDSSIHRFGFNWIPFDSITTGQAHQSTLVDVIGHITNMSDVHESANGDGVTKRIIVDLEDRERAKLSVTLWDRYVDQIVEFMDMSITSISNLFIADDESANCIVASVLKVNTDKGWYYDACKKCFNKLDTDGAIFYCTKCETSVPTLEARFKIELVVIDDIDTANIVIF